MKRSLALLLLLAPPLAAQRTPAPASDTTLTQLHWLTGCWELHQGGNTVTERWDAGPDGVLREVGRILHNDAVVDSETVELKRLAGRVIYEARPAGQAMNRFPLKTLGDRQVVFEDTTHDFPHRVGYRAVGTDSLEAWVAGPQEGREATYTFGYHRVACHGR